MTKEQEQFMDKLVEDHGPSMLQLAQRLTGDTKLAEDVVQETLLIACRKIDEVYPHINPAGWLFKTLGNICKRENKRAYRRREVPLEEWMLKSDLTSGSIRDCLPPGLTEHEETLLVWRLEDELTYEEMAGRLGITEGACRQQVSRAARKCRKLMK